MPRTKSYQDLHDRVIERPGAQERLKALREQTLMEIGLYELRRALEISQEDLAVELEISQSAISQLENASDLRLSTLRKYLEKLGARLELTAVFDTDEEQAVPIHIGGEASHYGNPTAQEALERGLRDAQAGRVRKTELRSESPTPSDTK